MPNHRGSKNNAKFGNGYSISTLHIRPLEGELKREEVLNYFSAFGDVKNVRIRNKPTNSYGFVTFSEGQSAAKALKIEFATIGGREVQITSANERYQDTASLLNLNDDCIFKIVSMKNLSILDLCSVAESSARLREIVRRIFAEEHGTWNFYSLVSSSGVEPAKRLLKNFGSLISDMKIRGNVLKGKGTSIFELIARYCSENLIALCLDECVVPAEFSTELQPMFNHLKKLTISDCTFKGDTTNLFAHCGSLVELDIFTADFEFIIKNTFPNLQHFKCHYPTAVNLDSFISRHKNLKRVEYWSYVDGNNSSFLSSIARNCKKLQELKCRIRPDDTLDLSSLVQLRKLNIYCGDRNITEATKGLDKLKSLQYLKLTLAEIDPEFVQTISQLKKLQVLILKDSYGLQYLDRIDYSDQLTKLKVISPKFFNLEVDLLIERLHNLEYLSVAVNRFKLHLLPYMKVVNAVRARPNRSKLIFRLYGDGNNYEFPDMERIFSDHAQIVEMRTDKSYFF